MAALAAAAPAAVEDAEFQIYAVDKYYFMSSNSKSVCFSTLPLRFGDAAAADVPEGNKVLFLGGFRGRKRRACKRVVAWRLELDGEQPDFFVLLPPADGGGWVRLKKPLELYVRTARTVLVTAQVLHFLRRNPDGPETALWIHLRQVLGNVRHTPSEYDLWNQTSLSLMRQFAATDPVLANSEALRAFVERISTEVGVADIQYIANDYFFRGSKDNYKPVCFSTLPLRFRAAATDVPEGNKALYLSGYINGSLFLRKKVVAWRLELDGEQPQFFVFAPADGGVWLRLAKAREMHEHTASTVLITAHMLHFLRRNPDAPETALWIHLRQVFGNIRHRPSEYDLWNQTSLSLMRQFVATDPVLANSEALRAFVERISTEVGGADIQCIAEYFFQGSIDNYKLVCFSTLPLRFSAAATDVPEGNKALYLSGYTNGDRLMRKEVVAWRLELDGEQPRFFVLAPADGGGWLRLAKAEEIYEHTARTVLITAHMLHFLRRNPDGPETALWIHLRQVIGNFRPSPSEDDLWNQTSLSLMRQFVGTDPVLANSEALRAFVERISTKVGDADIIGIADEYSFRAKDNYELVCFSTLPLWFGAAAAAAAAVPEGNKALCLAGFTAGGLRLLKHVVAWRLELDGEQPRFLVLVPEAGGGWLCLTNASKMYECTARTVLMTAQMLHFLRRNPDGPKTALWIHLYQVFGKFGSMPSEDDFRNQTSLSLMRQFTSMDPVLANSEVLRAFVERISTEVGGGADIAVDGEVVNEVFVEDAPF